MRVLVVNAGSSSTKLRIIEERADDATTVDAADLGAPGEDLGERLGEFLHHAGAVDVAGHRVVHGGADFRAPVLVDADVRRRLGELGDLAPLHNPPAIAGIDALVAARPGLANVACFDTSFHLGMPPEATRYALPAAWAQRWPVRRYGFHGLSCEWATRRAAAMLGRPVSQLRLVVCHLGGGASVTAVERGRSVDTTMGFTPLEGLVMATRSGDVDAGALVWMLRRGLDLDELDRGLEHEAGLMGLSGGVTGDMQVLLARAASGDGAAAGAVAAYLHRLRAKVAAMAAAMGGLDGLVFTGGVGEHAASIRADTCRDLAWIGVSIDEAANAATGDDDVEVSSPGAAVRTLVIHAREDLVVADACRRLMDAPVGGS